MINLNEEEDGKDIDEEENGTKIEDLYINNENNMEKFYFFKERFNRNYELNTNDEKMNKLQKNALIIDNPIQFCILVMKI